MLPLIGTASYGLPAAFDIVDHSIFDDYLQNDFGIQGTVLYLIKSFIDRSVNFAGSQSDKIAHALWSSAR